MAISPALATGYDVQKVDISFDVGSDNSVKQTTRFYFSSPVTDGSINYTLNEPVKNIVVYGGNKQLDSKLDGEGDNYNLQIFLDGPVETLLITYSASGIVFHSGSVNHLFTQFSFEKEIPIVNSQLKLPTGYEVYQNSYNPADGTITSDGKSIILAWNESNVSGSILFSVKYVNPDKGFIFLVAFAFLATGIVAFLYFHFRKKTAEAFLKGFREDEKKTILYLRGKQTALQRDLQAEFGFSRAKSTRIIYELEKKGLVRKQRHGRTNKLFWLNK
ncbi:MAG: hypothetical protein HY516_02090 [Candidatus Aenigmarchaeota archaeon]|nr:hypothetical protein [Candidatus Aenigmarchaeota archaeon]